MRSSAPALIGDLAIIGDESCFCSTLTGLLGRTALGAKKKELTQLTLLGVPYRAAERVVDSLPKATIAVGLDAVH